MMHSPKQRTRKPSDYVCVPLDIPRPSCLDETTCRPCSLSLTQAQWSVPVTSCRDICPLTEASCPRLLFSVGCYTESVTQAQPPTRPVSPTNPLKPAPPRAARVSRLDKKCQEALVQPKHAMPSASPPPQIPSELVDLIFSFLPLSVLPVTMQTCKLFHAIAERQLYFTVHCIDFFPHVDQQRCLETIANRISAAESVRHFGVRGLPWLEDEDIHLLSAALCAMTHLQSLDIDLGAPPEPILLHAELPLSPDLEALNVVDPRSAKFACEGGARSIRTARIASPMDECTAREVLPALGQSVGPLRQLQICVHLFSMADAIDVLSLLACNLPCLQTLGVEIRTVRKIEDQDFEVSIVGFKEFDARSITFYLPLALCWPGGTHSIGPLRIVYPLSCVTLPSTVWDFRGCPRHLLKAAKADTHRTTMGWVVSCRWKLEREPVMAGAHEARLALPLCKRANRQTLLEHSWFLHPSSCSRTSRPVIAYYRVHLYP